VGPYTAAAIAAIAFGAPATVVDGNIERVVSRLFRIGKPLPAAKHEIARALAPLVPAERPGDFAQALMDLGAGICTPQRPSCLLCPLAQACAAKAHGDMTRYPVKAARPARPVKQGQAWWIEAGDDVALVRRPPRGLLGGMPALPGTAWAVGQPLTLPFPGPWQQLPAPVAHGFTHFELRLWLACIRLPARIDAIEGMPILWTARQTLPQTGLPTLFARAAEAALAATAQPEFA
jgi:A/G-specific adenine glycosylase